MRVKQSCMQQCRSLSQQSLKCNTNCASQYMTRSTVPQLVTAELKCNTNCAWQYMLANMLCKIFVSRAVARAECVSIGANGLASLANSPRKHAAQSPCSCKPGSVRPVAFQFCATMAASSLPNPRPSARRVRGHPDHRDPLILSEQLTEPSEHHYMDLHMAFLRVTHVITNVAIDYEVQLGDPSPGQGPKACTVSLYVCATFQCATLPVHCPHVTVGRWYLHGRLWRSRVEPWFENAVATTYNDVVLSSYGRGYNFALRRCNFRRDLESLRWCLNHSTRFETIPSGSDETLRIT